MNRSISIRFFKPEDLENLFESFQRVVKHTHFYNDLAIQTELKKYSKEELSEKFLDDGKSIIVALSGEKVAGFCLTSFDSYTLWIDWIGVENEFRGCGVASKLLQFVEKSAKEQNYHKIWCDSRANNKPSIQMLQKAGFELITTIENHWYGQDFVLLQKFLTNE